MNASNSIGAILCAKCGKFHPYSMECENCAVNDCRQRELNGKIDRLRARISELEKALKPFANIDTDLLQRHWDAARRAYNKSPTVGDMEN